MYKKQLVPTQISVHGIIKNDKKQLVPTQISVHGIIKNDKKQILLQKRAGDRYLSGWYDFVSGRVDKNEYPQRALVREILEETGLVVDINSLIHRHTLCRFSEGAFCVELYFEVDNYGGTLRNLEPEKCSEMKWYNKNNLPKKMVLFNKKAFELSQAGVGYTEYLEKE